MRLDAHNVTDHHPIGPGAALFNLLHFKPRHSEAMGQVIRS
jgi:hypothetical protein